MQARPAIYLDSNAGAHLSPRVKDALLPFLSFGPPSGALGSNPSSIHTHGRQARSFISVARDQIAHSLSARPEQISFTSSGTEANQIAIRSILEPKLLAKKSVHWITTPVEHRSTLQMVEWFEGRGGKVSFLPVDSNGSPRVDALAAMIRPETILLSAIWVNNETGVVSSVSSLIEQAKKRGLIVHLDAAQAWGKIPIQANAMGADFLSFSGHKIGGLPGIGALFSNSKELIPERGTENILGAIALGAAAAEIDPDRWERAVRPLRDRLESQVMARIPEVKINGVGAPRVSNTSNLTIAIERAVGINLVPALDLEGYSVSAGSACASGLPEPSHVLRAMGHSNALALSSIRVSVSEQNKLEEIDSFVAALERVTSTSAALAARASR